MENPKFTPGGLGSGGPGSGGPGGGIPMGGGGNPLQMNINVRELETYVCERCENKIFEPAFIIKKVSALQSGTGKEAVVPLQVFRCANCGTIPSQFGGELLEEEK